MEQRFSLWAKLETAETLLLYPRTESCSKKYKSFFSSHKKVQMNYESRNALSFLE